MFPSFAQLRNSLKTVPIDMCVAHTEKGFPCKNKAKMYRVCGVHKTWAIDGSGIPGFEEDLQILRECLKIYKKEGDGLEQAGVNILDFQSSGNVLPAIIRGDLSSVPESHMKMVLGFKSFKGHVFEMWTRYDNYLVSNNVQLLKMAIND